MLERSRFAWPRLVPGLCVLALMAIASHVLDRTARMAQAGDPPPAAATSSKGASPPESGSPTEGAAAAKKATAGRSWERCTP